jgi:hypothetical protein
MEAPAILELMCRTGTSFFKAYHCTYCREIDFDVGNGGVKEQAEKERFAREECYIKDNV